MTDHSDSRMHVMVVDDDQFVLRAYTRVLGAHVLLTSTRTISEAKNYLGYHDAVDLIILDNGLPDGKGVDFARWLHEQHPKIRIVLITGGETTGFDDLVKAGVVESWLKKPIPLSKLKELAGVGQEAAAG